MIKTLHIRRERQRKIEVCLSAQERCPALAVASVDMLSALGICECKMFNCTGMSVYCNCERRDVSSNLMLTKY